jgi:hypothetical protein
MLPNPSPHPPAPNPAAQPPQPPTGRPKSLDEEKQNTVCSLIAAGVSLRQAARFVGCDPKSIRREAHRNGEFRRQLAKARSEAGIHPLQTLHQAAKANWRAALTWMERIDPDRFARPEADIITKREANQFVRDLIQSIDETISNPRERKRLFDLLTPAMPPAMRRRWSGPATRRAIDHMKQDLEAAERKDRFERQDRCREVYWEISKYLPKELCEMVFENRDLLDPKESFAQPPSPQTLAPSPQPPTTNTND